MVGSILDQHCCGSYDIFNYMVMATTSNFGEKEAISDGGFRFSFLPFTGTDPCCKYLLPLIVVNE